MRNFTVSLSGIGSLLKPTEEMANYISPEHARGQSKVPAYTPFIVPDVSAPPWPVPSKEHQSAVTRWRASDWKANDNPSSIPMQAWLLYQLGFLIAADLAGDWPIFGGLASQLNRLATAMKISITDSAAMALSYDRPGREFSAERDRSRQEKAIGVNFPIDFLSVGNPAMKLRALAEHPRAAVTTMAPNKEPTARQTKKVKETERDATARPLSRRRSRPRSVKKSAKRSRPRPRSKRRAETLPRRKPTMGKAMETRR